MPIVLDSQTITKAFGQILKHPGDPQHAEELLKVVQPIIKMTLDRFPAHLSPDIEQEIRLFVMKKADYLAVAYRDGQIKTVTNYFFKLCYNAAANYVKKEGRHDLRMVSIDDVKVEPCIVPKTYKKQKIIDRVREEIIEFIRVRFTDKKDSARAERYVMVLLNGKRPTFTSGNINRFSKMEQSPAKDTYSIVLTKLRELFQKYMDEWMD